MSFVTRFFKSPFINPKMMTEKTKMAWSAFGCTMVTCLTLPHMIIENDRQEKLMSQLRKD